MLRRTVLSGFGAANLSLTGCIGNPDQSTTESQSDTQTSEKHEKRTGGTPSLTDWERSTDCDDMHDSVIQVKRVSEKIGPGYSPILFSDLSSEETQILRTVMEKGGYGTCEPSESFDRFLTRISDHVEQQSGDMNVYLAYNEEYYGLYVEKSDEVYAY